MRTMVLFCLLAGIAGSANPGLKMRITEKGLNYVNQIAGKAIRSEMQRLEVPNQYGKEGRVSWSFTNVHTIGVWGPSTVMSFNSRLDGITWAYSSIYISLNSNWWAKYQHGWFKIEDHGKIKVDINDMSVYVTVGFGAKHGRPSLRLRRCEASIGSINVNFHSSWTAWLWNLFKVPLQNNLRRILPDNVCDLVRRDVAYGDIALAKLRLKEYIDQFVLNYDLISAKVHHTYLESFHKGNVYWNYGKTESPLTASPVLWWGESTKMLYIWLTEYTFNTFAYAAHHNRFFRYNVTRRDIPESDLGLISTTCEDECIGTFIPEIGEKHPNTEVEFGLMTSEVPKVKISGSSATVDVVADVEILVPGPGNKKLPLLKFRTDISVIVRPSLRGEQLVGNILDFGFAFKLTGSRLVETEDQEHLGHALKRLILNQSAFKRFTDFAMTGLNLPISPDIKFKDDKLVLQKGAIVIATDVEYQGNPASRLFGHS